MSDASTQSLHSRPCRLLAFPGFSAGVGWLVGTWLQLQQPALWSAGLYLGLAVCGGGLFSLPVLAKLLGCRSFNALKVLNALRWALAAALLAFAITGGRSLVFSAKQLAPRLEGQDLVVIGRVQGLPQVSVDRVRFRFETQSARALADDAPVTLPALLELNWYAPPAPVAKLPMQTLSLADSNPPPLPELPNLQVVQPGEIWQLQLRLKAPHGNHNPGGFDYELWLWQSGVQATGYVRDGVRDTPPQRLQPASGAWVARARQHLRDRILNNGAAPGQAGLIAALVVGDQAAIAAPDWETFRVTGVAHLVSISGLHITMFAWLASLGVGWLWRRSAALCLRWPAPIAALWGGLVLATAYALFSGWGLPAQRTVLMLAVVTVLRLTGVHWPWPWVWMLAAVAVVATDPWALLQPGFWLSFVAVAVLFADAPVHPERTVWSRIQNLVRVQCRLTLALAPLTLGWFGQVSLVGVLANLIAVPWLTLLVTPLAMAGVVWPPLWWAAGWALEVWMTALQWFATWPGAALTLPALPLGLLVAAAVGCALLVFRLPRAMQGLGLALLLPVCLWQPQRPTVGQFSVLAADVGQGNAVLIQTATHALLYDTGPPLGPQTDTAQRVLLPLLQARAVTLDQLVLSHRDVDHAGGAASVLRAFPSLPLLSSIEANHPLQQHTTVTRCEAGQAWDWDGVRFEVLHPGAADYTQKRSPNARSCVVRVVSAQGRVALLTGDLEKAQELQLVRQGAPLQADFLLVPHHGSRTSSSALFLDAVQPDVALVQAGYRNRYRHPQQGVLDRYAERGIVVHDSPHCGAFVWNSLQSIPSFCTRLAHRKYWHHNVP